MMLFFTIAILYVLYAALIFFYYRSWKEMPMATLTPEAGTIRFSVIIPARNEGANIVRLLQSLQKQTYPKRLFEVIVVDDHSTDDTAQKVTAFFAAANCTCNGRLVQLQQEGINAYKKKAIEMGIAASGNEWIAGTDADCIVPPNWLQQLAICIQQKNAVFIAAPVSFITPVANTPLYVFQALDFMTLQGITAASVYKNIHTMCNGANLAYNKNVFYEVGGFNGIDNIASGDDMLLMHKIWRKYPQEVHYIKSTAAIVHTAPAHSWRAFIQQRIRWASKGKSYEDKRIFAVLLLVYLFNFSFLVLLVAAFFSSTYLYALLMAGLLKTVAELPFIHSISGFFCKQRLLRYFFFFQPLHIAYTIVAGFLGSFGTYEWKGRKVK